MPDTLIAPCCKSCWHSNESFCPDLLACLAEGPVCHRNEACRTRRATGRAARRRDLTGCAVVFVGTGTCGLGAGAARTLAAVRSYLSSRDLPVDIVEVGCIGLCSMEPIVDVQLPGRTRVSYHGVTEKLVPALLDEAFEGGVPADRVLGQHRNATLQAYSGVPHLDEHPFFAPQTRWVLANCGIIDPGNLDEYLTRGGYTALATVLRTSTPVEVCHQVELSGLRGRGGGGFPTGRKWAIAQAQEAAQKYLICNADEGDPGAFMDRAVIEGDPHRLLEGMAIAAYAIGASKAYVYIRAEYPLAIARLRQAIAQARANGMLGSHVLGTEFCLEIVIKQGAGAFVCGEETALIHSIEGKRGMPRPRPPYPASSGLFGKPTVINNVETLANVPTVVNLGATRFGAVGTAGSKGTKVFALSGKIARTGLVEVAMGTTLRQIVFDIGGGIPDGRTYKAVQIGGPSGGCIPTQLLDIEIDYESLKGVGAMMGSGGLVVMDDATCMVDVAKFFMDFIQRESCGKCIPCREGTRRMLETLQSITRPRRGESGVAALQRFQGVMALESLAEVIKDTSLCGLGQTAPNPVLSTLRHFREEYEAHVYERRCPAKACNELLTYSIDVDKCIGCTLCARACPAGAILGTLKSPHYVVAEKCIGCGGCVTVCRPKAVLVA
jgi:NADH:ubiquinone oxidoreductase subunit F (NADH-binding)/Pyruvate/2-oxoacid:ferredoxin oxidoreductase delta subunit/(2Fe-2S) ferredoxin